ncbi:serine/threonine protein kinase [Pyxidicoccus xibeiensis]|uniref:serine/threonine protein kinase n=1 Tax=Pyxidicoccus xibeiensis TaxID=2906759 RepID=UPI0020A7C425|nr:protein kinase [Pyxidicoccus xibeiensis]MCP3141261.1 protein kinase [Pyxidicoccus xibeiensis]
MSSPQTAIPFGKYLLIKRLAVGGMAELFLAQRPPEPELVVLKRILPYLSEEPEFVQMFLDEARIAAQLHHPNIVQVHELGKEGDNIFIAMEYVEGVDLRRVVAEEAKYGATVPCGVAARICAMIAGGLDYAHHSRGVDGRPLELIHRDVSPQNVMIGYDGRVKLVDFGIAKAGAFMERSKPGVIKGKFLYLAPEQVSQERLDHRADIFALGTMLYEITTGKQPFAKPTTEGILYAIRYEDPAPPHLLRADYPEALSRIIMRCLTKDRAQRYQRASAVRADLEAFLESGALRQSLDISEYVARLLGEEEERTILHIPVAKGAGRRDVTVPLPARLAQEAEPPRRPPPLESTAPTLSSTTPAGELAPGAAAQLTPGLTARPTPRRTSGDAVPVPPPYADEPEPATLMARPRDLPTGGRQDEEDEEADVSTAIQTTPTGYKLAAEVAAELEDVEEAESTISMRYRGREERPRHPPTAPPVAQPPARRSGPHAEPSSPPPPPRTSSAQDVPRSRRVSPPPAPLTAPPRRTPRPDEEASQSVSTTAPAPPRRTPRPDEEASQSVSLTPPSPPRRPSALHLEVEDEVSRSVSITPATVNQRAVSRSSVLASRRASAPDEEDDYFPTDSGLSSVEHTDPTPTLGPDPDDDESTAGYATYDEALYASTEATPSAPRRKVPGVLLAAVGGLVLLALGTGVVWALYPRPTVPPMDLSKPAGQQPPESPAPGDSAPGTDTPPPATGEAPSPLAPAVDAGSALAAAAPDAGSASDAAPGGESVATAAAGTPGPTLVAVRFDAPARTALRQEGGDKLPVNKVVSLPPGSLRVRYACPGRRAPKGSKSYLVEPASEGPLVLQVPCRSRR